MEKKKLVKIMVTMFVCCAFIASYMLKNGLAKADSASIIEVEIDDGFVVLMDSSNAQNVEAYNNGQGVNTTTGQIAEAQVITGSDTTVQETEVVTVTDVSTDNTASETINDPVVLDSLGINFSNSYTDVAGAEQDKNYGAAQGFDISGDYAYYAKIDNAANDTVRQAKIYAYNFKTKTTSNVYENTTSDDVFKIGHANCLCVKDNYMYIATMLDNGPSIYRYTINNNNGSIILNDLQKFTVYSHDKSKTSGIKITGIHYAPDLNAFFVKLGLHVYYGNFEGSEFKWTKHFKIDTNLSFNTPSGTVNMNANEYTHQGMYYKDGALYFPMTNSDTWNESIVVKYPVSASTQTESTLAEDPNSFVRITSQEYSKLWEIECVAAYNGEMYAFNNMTTSSGVTDDKIIKIKDFSF